MKRIEGKKKKHERKNQIKIKKNERRNRKQKKEGAK
jgi:hypothetical protein